MDSDRQIRVAVLSSGLGRVLRGFERFAFELSRESGPDAEFVCFGARSSERLVGVRSLSRDGALAKLLSKATPRSSYQWEGMTFAASVLPRLIRGGFDVIHIMDAPVLNVFHRLRRHLEPSRLVFTNGVAMMDPCFFRADHVHQVSLLGMERSLAGGIAANSMTLIPYPVEPDRLRSRLSRVQARRRLELPETAPMVLSVAAVTREKRLDHLAHSVAAVPGLYLLVVGPIREEGLLLKCSKILGPRLHHRTLPFEDVGIAYRCADVFALCSLEEGMGISLVEAAALGLPVIAHRSPHFAWLLGDEKMLVDMSDPDELSRRLRALVDGGPDWADLAAFQAQVQERFSWTSLRPQFIEMYRSVANA